MGRYSLHIKTKRRGRWALEESEQKRGAPRTGARHWPHAGGEGPEAPPRGWALPSPRGPGTEHRPPAAPLGDRGQSTPPPPPQGTGRRAPPPAALKPAVSQAVSHPLFAAPEPGSCAASVIPGSFLLLFCRLKSSAGWGGDSCSRPQERPARFS